MTGHPGVLSKHAERLADAKAGDLTGLVPCAHSAPMTTSTCKGDTLTAQPDKDHAQQIRQHAHRLAAEGLEACLNMWELELYYADPADQDALGAEIQRIANRLRKQGGGR